MPKRKILYRVFESMVQWAVFEAYATSADEARRIVMDGGGEIEFSFTDEPVPDSRRAVLVRRVRDGDGKLIHEPTD